MGNEKLSAPVQFKGVMVSSTFTDLKEHRAALIRAIKGQMLTDIAMENDTAKPDLDVIDSSLQMVRDSSAPPNFGGVVVGYGFDLWVPVTLQPMVMQGGNKLINRGDRWLQATARLKPAVTISQANTEMQALARQISEAHGEYPSSSAIVRRMRDRFAGPLLTPLFSILLVVTGHDNIRD